MAYLPQDTPPLALLADLAGRREFNGLSRDISGNSPAPAPASAAPAFIVAPAPALKGLRLDGAQLFVREFQNPHTPYPRLLVNWQTGTGKSIAAASIAHAFAGQYRARAALGERQPCVTVVSFTFRETIQEDILQHPEFGFVSRAEVEELRALRAQAHKTHGATHGAEDGADDIGATSIKTVAGLLGTLRRRLTDRARGGYYQFFGYKEFASRLFTLTARGRAAGVDILGLARQRAGDGAGAAEAATFAQLLRAAVERGDVVVDQALLDGLRGGLLICDEIHNTYNMQAANNYGLAIQYALDSLGDAAPRVVLMSATPVTGSAAEVVDLLNLLVPKRLLPDGIALRREDFFERASTTGTSTATGTTATAATAGADDVVRIGRHLYARKCLEALPATQHVSVAAADMRALAEEGLPIDAAVVINDADDAKSDSTPRYPVAVLHKGKLRLVGAVGASAESGGVTLRVVAKVATCAVDAAESDVRLRLLDGAADRIAALSAGRVSFLLDSDTDAYPRLVFHGETVPGVPYLPLTLCAMSDLHARTLRLYQAGGAGDAISAADAGARKVIANAYTLYDMAFPNPSAPTSAADSVALPAADAAGGLYLSEDTAARLAAAPAEWRAAAGVTVSRGSEYGLPPGTSVIGGSFLRATRPLGAADSAADSAADGRLSATEIRELNKSVPPMGGLERYSAKMTQLLRHTLEAIRRGPGKIMVYHHRVRMSGVLLLQEMFRANDFLDEFGVPTENTCCAVCGYASRSKWHVLPKLGSKVAPPAEATADADTADADTADADAATDLADAGGAIKPHAFIPARFIVVHSDVSSAAQMRSIARFNAPANLQGYVFRIFIGSKVIRESFNFRAVRYVFVMSLPGDVPNLIQVLGRARRKRSHAELPPGERQVDVRFFVSVDAAAAIGASATAASSAAAAAASPELQRYIDKSRDYLVIQEVERALRRNAVDGFANRSRIQLAISAAAGAGKEGASLAALPYDIPAAALAAASTPKDLRLSGTRFADGAKPLATTTFNAYGYSSAEVRTIAAACFALFESRPVWTRDDLWMGLRRQPIRGLSQDSALFDEGNFELALALLQRSPWGAAPAGARVVARAGDYYILAALTPEGTPDLDIECYIRGGVSAPGPAATAAAARAPPGTMSATSFAYDYGDSVKVELAGYLSAGLVDRAFAARLRDLERYLAGPPALLPHVLTDFSAAFHFELLRRIIVSGGGGGSGSGSGGGGAKKGATSDDARLWALYRQYRLVVGEPGGDSCGYVTPESVRVYARGDKGSRGQWRDEPLEKHRMGARHEENRVAVAFVTSANEYSNAPTHFKLRPPVQALTSRSGDARTLARGAVCETRPRAELEGLIKKMTALLGEKGEAGGVSTPGGTGTPPGAASTAGSLCLRVKTLMLALELRARKESMTSGTRWLYLYADRLPNLSALLGARQMQ